jgi:hypothetical protein
MLEAEKSKIKVLASGEGLLDTAATVGHSV